MPHHRRRRLPWASAAAPPEVLDGTRLSEPCGDQARCSTAAPEAMRVDVHQLDAASVGARVGRSVRRLPRPPTPPYARAAAAGSACALRGGSFVDSAPTCALTTRTD